MIDAMIRRHLLAVVRCLVLFAVAVAGFVLAVLSVFAASRVVPYPLAAKPVRGVADLPRRLTRDWAGVPVEIAPRPEIPVPQQREDGWYVHDKQLYKSPRMPRFLLRIEVLSKDPAYKREWIYLISAPFIGGLAALIAPGLAVLGALVIWDVRGVTFGLGAAAPAVRVAAGLALVLLGIAAAPVMVRLYARASASMLQPPGRSWWHTSGIGPWIQKRNRATWHAGGLAGLALAAFGGSLVNLV